MSAVTATFRVAVVLRKTMNNSAPRQISVQTKINLALVLVLVAIMSASLFIAAST